MTSPESRSPKKTSPPVTDEVGLDTSGLYDENYFRGSQSASNYDDYVTQAYGPSRILAETLLRMFRPATALDMGCAVGHTVNRLRELGVNARGYDISEWAVKHAGVRYIEQFDFSNQPITRRFELVYSYDVVEHVPEDRLEYAVKNLWNATRKYLVIVPALYPEGTTHDPNEATHLIFHDRAWWLNFFTQICGCFYDPAATDQLANEEHSKLFNYSDRVFVFSRIRQKT